MPQIAFRVSPDEQALIQSAYRAWAKDKDRATSRSAMIRQFVLRGSDAILERSKGNPEWVAEVWDAHVKALGRPVPQLDAAIVRAILELAGKSTWPELLKIAQKHPEEFAEAVYGAS